MPDTPTVLSWMTAEITKIKPADSPYDIEIDYHTGLKQAFFGTAFARQTAQPFRASLRASEHRCPSILSLWRFSRKPVPTVNWLPRD